jgi:2,3-bisphosphoglycerate-independent phosphoglycerate mutase
MSVPVPIILAILDGWGLDAPSPSNAITIAHTPNMDRFNRDFPSTRLIAHNGMVGLPEGQMGNSEVGHLNIGAGRIVYQEYTRINRAMEQGEFTANPVFNDIMDRVQAAGSRLHLCGLLSDGGVHSHICHLIALVELAASKGLDPLIHCFMDGRDTPPSSGLAFMEELLAELARIGRGRVASISGRYWAMDRDKRWDRVQRAWQALVHGKGLTASDPLVAVRDAYERGESDEFIVPTVLVDAQVVPLGKVEDNDALISFNFRADRVRELCHAFGDADFLGFDRGPCPCLPALATMTEYEVDFTFPVAFPSVMLKRILGEEVSRHGRRQLRIAETEKYAHVTYFFNGGCETPFAGEDRLLINSPRDVATYDLKPEMSAVELTDTLLQVLGEREAAGIPYDLVILNFANGDMVGHTGVLAAAVVACETVDKCLGRIEAFVCQRGGVVLITADHGNAETMVNSQISGPYTAHTLNPVPFIVVADAFAGQAGAKKLRDGGALKDIAPTILELMELPIPKEMDGESLLVG